MIFRMMINAFKYQIGYRRGDVYRKFMLVPALIAWSICNLAWASMIAYWFFCESIWAYNVTIWCILAVALYFALPFLAQCLFAYLSTIRLWKWGGSRFVNKHHMMNWMRSVGSDDFELIITVDERIKRAADIFKLMRP